VPGLSPALDEICRKALGKELKNRYPSMKALIADLANYLKATPLTEGAGPLVPNAGLGELFGAATVAPAQAPVQAPGQTRGKLLAMETQAPAKPGTKPPSSVRKPEPARTMKVSPREEDEEDDRGRGRPAR